MPGAIRFPQLRDPDWLRHEYVDAGRSCGDIAEVLGCSRSLVEQALQRFDIGRRGRWYGRWKAKLCERCDSSFTPSGPAQRFCPKRECRYGVRECPQCGARVSSVWQARGRGKGFCSSACAYAFGHRPPSRVGSGVGRYRAAGGYVAIRVPADTPGARRKVGAVWTILEHRYVAQQMLGRPLEADETVHHINGIKDDNRPQNLQVRSGRHGKGAVLACGDCGSHNVVHVPIA